MSEPITTYNGRVVLFNNGVVDVVQGETSLVDENKVAHIPEGNVEIDNLTIIKNADNELEVPFDNNTIYRDSEDGFIKANVGAEVHDSKIILCTQVGSDPAGPVGSFTLNQDSNKTITIPIPEPEVKEYTGGTDIEVTSEGVINYTGSGGGGSYTAGESIKIANNVISVDSEALVHYVKEQPAPVPIWNDNLENATYDSMSEVWQFTRTGVQLYDWRTDTVIALIEFVNEMTGESHIAHGTGYWTQVEDSWRLECYNWQVEDQYMGCFIGYNATNEELHVNIPDAIGDLRPDPTEIVVNLQYQADPNEHISLGDRVGSGWTQDQTYSVKFKNGQLDLDTKPAPEPDNYSITVPYGNTWTVDYNWVQQQIESYANYTLPYNNEFYTTLISNSDFIAALKNALGL